jgi:hypothetical protein
MKALTAVIPLHRHPEQENPHEIVSAYPDKVEHRSIAAWTSNRGIV